MYWAKASATRHKYGYQTKITIQYKNATSCKELLHKIHALMFKLYIFGISLCNKN